MSIDASSKPSLGSEERPESHDGTMSNTETTQSLQSPSNGRSKDPSQRRRSIQFSVGNAEAQLSTRPLSGDSPIREAIIEKEHKPAAVNRGPSPPPPRTYERGVSFDTFDNRDAADFSLTLNYKHKGYQSTRRSRTFLCGTDQNDYSEFALEWLMDELVDDGDEIVCLRAVEKDSQMASGAGIEEGKYRDEAEKLFEQVIQKNSQDEKAISLILELAVGKVEDIIQRMIRIYEPAVLVVGTRGRNLKGVHSLLPGSVSKYCLQHSPIPVVVVRPSPKREKKKKKRRADPARRSYNHILEMSSQRGSRIFDASSSTESSSVSKLPDEEAAVAEALGLPMSYTNSRSSLSVSDRSSLSHEDADSTAPGMNSLDAVVMKSPLGGSPTSSEESLVVSDDTQKAVSPEIPGESSKDSPDNAGTSTETDETDKTDTPADEGPDASERRVSIPVIEVFHENDNDNDEQRNAEQQ